MPKVILFQFESDVISITIQAYFEGEIFVMEGYDTGKLVTECWGDSDYKYCMRIPEREVRKLYPLLNVADGDKKALLASIAAKYHTNTSYSEFCDFLEKNGVQGVGSA
jgi:hypothetical protein